MKINERIEKMAKEDKSFKDLTTAELKAVAAEFAVDLDGKTNKQAFIAALEDDGVTFEMYKTLMVKDEEEDVDLALLDDAPLDDENPEPAPAEDEEQFVIKMTRANHTYEVRGHRFTRANPYALVNEEDADFLIEHGGGFRMASPRELKEFYGV